MTRRITEFDDLQAIKQMKIAGRNNVKRKTIAKEFCEAMTNAQHSAEESQRIERLFAPIAKRIGTERRLTFNDNSYVIFSSRDGVIELPIEFA